MKKIIVLIVLSVMHFGAYSQKFRFNRTLNKFCYKSTLEFKNIPDDRKQLLDHIAFDLSKKKNVVFSCYTNTRRTQLLQTWAQTAFYYYGISNKTSSSFGDTLSEIAPMIISVLKKSGFIFSETKTKPKTWVFYVGKKNDGYVIYPKVTSSLMNEKENVIVSVCIDGEPRSNVGDHALSLPYKSPISSEKTSEEKSKYETLNRQIAIEMLYLAEKTREILLNFEK